MSKRNRKGLQFLASPSVMSPVNKRLNFEVEINDDNAENELLPDLHQFDLELDQVELGSEEELEQFDKFSPCRTRSGLVYESGVKKHKFRLGSRQRKMRSRTLSGQSGTGHLADCSENESETSNSEYTEDLVTDNERPPPLNYFKPSVSRFSQIREKPHTHDIPSSPIQSNMLDDLRSPSKEMSDSKVNHDLCIILSLTAAFQWPRDARNLFTDSPLNSPSPPSHTMRAMRLFDVLGSPNSVCAISSPKTAPRLFGMKSRLLFDEDGESRRSSFPLSNMSKADLHECDSTSVSEKPKMANINPFTPEGIVANRKRNRSQTSIAR